MLVNHAISQVVTASPGPRSRLASHHPEGHGREWWRLGTLDFSTATGRDFLGKGSAKANNLGQSVEFFVVFKFMVFSFFLIYIYLFYFKMFNL